ncbi:MAG: hypothetical protein RLZZ373_17 [Pseudomonadota bacterium]
MIDEVQAAGLVPDAVVLAQIQAWRQALTNAA